MPRENLAQMRKATARRPESQLRGVQVKFNPRTNHTRSWLAMPTPSCLPRHTGLQPRWAGSATCRPGQYACPSTLCEWAMRPHASSMLLGAILAMAVMLLAPDIAHGIEAALHSMLGQQAASAVFASFAQQFGVDWRASRGDAAGKRDEFDENQDQSWDQAMSAAAEGDAAHVSACVVWRRPPLRRFHWPALLPDV